MAFRRVHNKLNFLLLLCTKVVPCFVVIRIEYMHFRCSSKVLLSVGYIVQQIQRSRNKKTKLTLICYFMQLVQRALVVYVQHIYYSWDPEVSQDYKMWNTP